MLKTWFKLLRVTLYRNDLRGNKNYFELVGGLSYRGFELPRVKLLIITYHFRINYVLNLETAEFLELGLCDFGETLFSARH